MGAMERIPNMVLLVLVWVEIEILEPEERKELLEDKAWRWVEILVVVVVQMVQVVVAVVA
jgi:hypothetical protein